MMESDMEAAQHLIQLSEDSSCSDNISGKRNRSCDGEEVHHITAANKIREIFGEDKVYQPKKKKKKKEKRRYRSLVNIYMATAPISMLQRRSRLQSAELRQFDICKTKNMKA
ncbi:hypothetical protein JHK85_015706 [Glycine max]|nr:hypothetical protein JHK85_015706 [Glycine max]